MTRSHRLLAAALVLGAAASACLTAVAPAHAAPRAPAVGAVTAARGLIIRLLDEPTALKRDPRAAVYVIDQLAPGTTIVRHVQVTNDSGAATDVRLYASAATIGTSGFAIAPGVASNELTGWTTMSPSSTHLAAGASATVTVTISVPRGASNGERYEGLVAALPPVRQSNGYLLENRVAVRTYLSVSGGADPVAAPGFTISALQAERRADGTPEVAATITNTGGRALDLTGRLRLSDGPGGLSAGPFSTQGASTLGVGASGQIYVTLDKQIPAGPWTARIDATSGTLTHSATAVITFPAASGGKAAPVAATPVPITRNRGVVAAVAGGLLSLVVVGLVIVLWRRRRREDDEHPATEPGELTRV